MNSIELKPCPFCGGEAVLIATSNCSGYVSCTRCGIKTNKYWDESMSMPEKERKKWYTYVAKLWNRRAVQVDPVKHGKWIADYDCGGVVLSCSLCNEKYWIDSFDLEDGYRPNYCPGCGTKMDGE